MRSDSVVYQEIIKSDPETIEESNDNNEDSMPDMNRWTLIEKLKATKCKKIIKTESMVEYTLEITTTQSIISTNEDILSTLISRV